MQQTTRVMFSAAAALIVWASPVSSALAQPTKDYPARLEVSAFVGWLGLDDVNGLGNAFYKEDVPQGSMMLGLRASYPLPMHNKLWFEAELGFSPTQLPRVQAAEEPQGSNDASVLSYRLLARYDVYRKEKLAVYGALGVGQMRLSADKPYVSDGDTDTAVLAGVGVALRLNHRLTARVDARWSSSDARPDERALDDQGQPTGDVVATYGRSNNVEALVGISYAFGGQAEDSDGDGVPDDVDKCPKLKEDKDGFQDEDGCPDIDNDGDGVIDRADRCPLTPEDKDGFRDDDGCPDPDNDNDGIADSKDRCPNEPEDKDGYQDSDGCPDLDNDRDGVPDTKDRCPMEREDKDGFQDEDGCPDPDNDNDGIPDAKDKCPNKPETKNGLDDEDGCPDSLPTQVSNLFDKPLEGVSFRGRRLKKGSEQVLGKFIEMLLEVTHIKVEIHVHTHTKGKAKRLKKLANRRGKAIVKYYVGEGIEADRFVIVAHGGDEPVDTGKGRKARKANERVVFKMVKGAKAK